MKKIIVIGSGGHAKIVIDILSCMTGIEIIGITSNTLEVGTKFLGYKVLGDDYVLNNYREVTNHYAAMGLGGFKDNLLREKTFNHIKSLGIDFMNVIHPSAIISSNVKLGEGVVIFPGVILNTEVRIGKNTIIATGSTIDHETIVGNHVLISAGVTVGAYSKINNKSVLALGSKVVSGVTVGENVVVAAGAVVLKDIENNKTVYGIPASEKKSNGKTRN